MRQFTPDLDCALSYLACLAFIRQRWEADCRTAEPITALEIWQLWSRR